MSAVTAGRDDSAAAGKDTVSVVIPTYYRNGALEAALESVFAQGYEPIEIIVVDDSGEEHAAAVAGVDERVTYVGLEENRGAHVAREVGVRRCSGRYVQLLDDDDRLLDEKLDKQVTLLRNNPAVGVAYCGLRWADGPTVMPDSAVRGNVLEAALRFATSPAMMGTMLIEREVLEQVLPFEHRHGADDIGMKIELARRTEFDFVAEVLFERGNTEDSLGVSRAAVDGRHEIIEKYDDLYDRYPDARREALAETHLVSGQFLIRDRGWSLAAITEFLRACRYVPGLPLPYVGSLLASLLGRTGYQLLRRLYAGTVLGDTRRGKST